MAFQELLLVARALPNDSNNRAGISLSALGYDVEISLVSANVDRNPNVSVLGYAWLLANEVFRLLLVWWPVTGALVVTVIVLMHLRGLQTDQQLRSLPSVLLLFPVLIVLWASAVRVDNGEVGGSTWRLTVVAVLLMLHFAATAAVVYVSRSFRPQTLSLGILIGWVTAVCGYVAVLAVTGQLSALG